MKIKPKCDQWYYVSDRVMEDFHFFYIFYLQVCYDISLMKKKIIEVTFKSTHSSLWSAISYLHDSKS